MGKKLRNILTIVLAAMGIFVAALCFNSTKVSAAAYTSNDLISSAQIINQDKNYSYSSTVGVQYNWDTTGTDISLKDGDTLTMELPEQLRAKSDAGVPFDITDDDGHVIGSAVVNSDNTVTVTFNENVETYHDVSGSITIGNGIGVSDSALAGNNEVEFPTMNGNQTSNMNVIPSENNISKKGVMSTDENGDHIITWTILANRQELDLKNMNVYEDVTQRDPEEYLEYVQGSVIVNKAHWTSNTSYKKDELVDSSNYTLTENSNGFHINIPDSANQMYAITIQTKIPADKATDGETVFKNQAQITWGKPGTDGETPRESASGSVTSDITGDNSGSGSGNVKGNVVLTKISDDSEYSLEGAVYDLYEVGNDVAIKTGLTTDADGKISISNLAPGEYYFKETTPPSGFQLNSNEIPFTITGDTTTPIQLTGRDDPISEPLGSILIQKLDLETGHKLNGAEFEITQTSGNEVGKTWTTTADDNGLYHVSDLPYGTYTIQETKAPDGYILDSSIREFTISAENPNPGLFTFDNDKETGTDPDFSASIKNLIPTN
ncbi:SpaA isopeptide-forming pilin-related protein [Companilactobacillus allii]|uniref:Collagen-binding protein n=1 Tax=Companilactobacillus allii TaxID=1847728 RepID=A0A1P8Q603_9LACO|nr:SpaA isopeptide-forming pilin-related protein [Companilactobacillus allii]APX73289.1 hypothetical protein BTM29_12355 [Companilactobacillus allii]USQ68103.1 SpaA isopeptide-forming pilin-related protein [Companilactobacillus allii]